MTPRDMDATDREIIRRERDRIKAARRFPKNTCPASRHVQRMGEVLAKGQPYPMVEEEPYHVATSLLSVVASLYEARSEIERLKKEPRA